MLALATVREGDTLVVPKLDWLAKFVPHGRAREKFTASSPNCPSGSSGNSAACMPRARLPSAIWPSSYQSQDQPSIAYSIGVIPLSIRSCPLTRIDPSLAMVGSGNELIDPVRQRLLRSNPKSLWIVHPQDRPFLKTHVAGHGGWRTQILLQLSRPVHFSEGQRHRPHLAGV